MHRDGERTLATTATQQGNATTAARDIINIGERHPRTMDDAARHPGISTYRTRPAHTGTIKKPVRATSANNRGGHRHTGDTARHGTR